MRISISVLLASICFVSGAQADEKQPEQPQSPPAPKVQLKTKNYEELPEQPLLPPEQAADALEVPDDLKVELVLSEPQVRQPIFIDFDERGRMWVMNYEQYPYPEGLKMISRDKYWRAVYDKTLQPPPHRTKGRDRITIHEDTNGDGQFDSHKVFLEGLNIASSFARGRGGVFVLMPPHLVFYPDKNNDDIPDGDPEVLLEGFGIEDTHSLANSLRWGPDGWLYGAQGSTVSGNIKHFGVKEEPVRSMGQLIWRYHPETKQYEIFAEGGGNAFGVEIDSKGRVFSGHNGANTRGFHYVQGGYYQKGFAKHGPLSNPFTFGYFKMMKSHDVARFTHDFIIYEGANLPEKYDGKVYGVEPLQGRIVYCDFLPDTSSYRTNDLGHVIKSSDTNFRPVDIILGPDGAIYVADMYEPQIAHLMHFAGRVDDTNGRVFRLSAKEAESNLHFDLSRKTTPELIKLLSHKNKWYRQMVLRLLADRQDKQLHLELKKKILSATGQEALELLWALNLIGGLEEEFALKTLSHSDPFVRSWTIRLMCDDHQVGPEFAQQLTELARTEKHMQVRSQIACSAKRLPTEQTLKLTASLLTHSEDVDDLHLPLLCWWAVEHNAGKDRDQILNWLKSDPGLWSLPMFQTAIAGNLMQRYAQSGSRQDLLTCAKLFSLSPDEKSNKLLMAGFENAFKGRSLTDLPGELVTALTNAGGGSVSLRFRQGEAAAIKEVLAAVKDEKNKPADKLEYVKLFGESRLAAAVPVMLELLSSTKDEPLQRELLTSLQAYASPEIASAVLKQYPALSTEVQEVAQTLLIARKNSTRQLLEAVDSGKIKPDSLPLDVVRKMTIHQDKRIAELIRTHWASVEGASNEEMQAAIAKYSALIKDGQTADPYEGKELYAKSCGKCHILFGDGGRVGPELTHFNRKDWLNMLINIVNPSADIREGFQTQTVITDEGRVVTGFLFDEDNQVLVLRGADGQKITIEKESIEEVIGQKKSIMPEGLLQDYTDQQIRNLFSYLKSAQPLP